MHTTDIIYTAIFAVSGFIQQRVRARWRHRAESLVCLRGETWRRLWQQSPNKTQRKSTGFAVRAEPDTHVSGPRLASGVCVCVRRFYDARVSVFKPQEPQRWWKTRSDRGNYRPAKPRWDLPHIYFMCACLLSLPQNITLPWDLAKLDLIVVVFLRI